MKTLTDHVIIYDNDCPMCDLYTGAFVKTGMLDRNGRIPYSEMNYAIANTLDRQRACDEIALVNTTNGNVIYGIESLFAILSHRFPLLKTFFRVEGFKCAMKKLYAFISYNRKVIAPPKTFESETSCTPAFNLRYRITYLFVTWIFTSWILNKYALLLAPLIPSGSLYREMLICGGQIIFHGVLISFLRRERLMHYLGNMMTVSMMGIIALLPAMLAAKLGVTNPIFFAGWFFLVVSGMLLEHMRRVRLLGIHWSASVGWIIYRLIVLTFIFSL